MTKEKQTISQDEVGSLSDVLPDLTDVESAPAPQKVKYKIRQRRTVYETGTVEIELDAGQSPAEWVKANIEDVDDGEDGLEWKTDEIVYSSIDVVPVPADS